MKMILNAKPLNPDCLTQVALSQKDNERNHCSCSFPKLCTSVHFSLYYESSERRPPLYQCWSQLKAMSEVFHLPSAHECAYPLILPFYSQALFIIFSPAQPSNFVCYYSSPRTLPASKVRLLRASYPCFSVHAIPSPQYATPLHIDITIFHLFLPSTHIY